MGSGAYKIIVRPPARSELNALRKFDQNRVIDAVEEHLRHDADIETRNRKRLKDAEVGFEHELPLWQLRVGDFRVFCDVDQSVNTVYVRAIRAKSGGKTTEEIAQ